MNNFSEEFINEIMEILDNLDLKILDEIVIEIKKVKERNGRIFFCGSGGGAGHSSHAAADFRKLLNIESYSITDNVSELTAKINDDGWEDSYADILKASNFVEKDCLFVFSVGGGSINPPISNQIVKAIDFVKTLNGTVLGVVGREGGHTKKMANVALLIPVVSEATVTAHTEGMQAYIWHFLVSHPILNPEIPKWESIK
tara:strand:+ start:655 stop:1254 length:600 start_codon:yes stop_codon:yes gene_type:complete